MAVEFACAPITLFGDGILQDMVPYIKREGLSHGLIVSDRGLERAGLVEPLRQMLWQEGIRTTVYLDVEANPTDANVEAGLEAYKESGCDFLISMGGGSPTDCTKAIRVLTANGGSLSDYRGNNKSRKKGPFYIAVNTTAGTASEISRAFLISDPAGQEKMIFKDNYAMPDIAVEDVALMKNLPAHITAQTGMDALTHAVEGYLSVRSSFLTDLAAKEAVSLIAQNLPMAVTDPHNAGAREGMVYAQYLAGMSFGNAGLGLVHAMAHALGAVYNLPHGLCNAVLLPYVLDFYLPECIEKLEALDGLLTGAETGQDGRTDDLGRTAGAIGRTGALERAAGAIGRTDALERAADAVARVRRLSGQVGTRVSLHSLGVKEEDIGMLAQKALSDGCIATAPVMPDQEQTEKIYRKAWEGDGEDETCG